MKKYQFFLMGVMFLVPFVAFGQENGDTQESYPQAHVTSDLNIYNALILQQTDEIVISFTLQNDFSKAQGDVNYDVRLYELDSAGEAQNLFYREEFDDTLSISAGESLEKQVMFNMPENANGTYELWVFVYTTSGNELSFANLGTVQTNAAMKSISIQRETCGLVIDGIEEKFHPLQGVDIDPKQEKINLECEIKNNKSSAQDISAVFSTKKYSMYGESVDVDGNSFRFVIEPGTQKKVVVPVPLPKESGAYSAKIVFSNDEQVTLESLYLHYVIQGESASINDISTDRESYDIGEKMTLSVAWSPSADGFAGSRKNDENLQNTGESGETPGGGTEIDEPMIHISVENDKNEKCIEDISENLTSDNSYLQYEENVIAKCQNVNVRAEIRNGKGDVLAQYNVLFDENAESIKNTAQNDTRSMFSWKTILMVLIGGLPIIILLVFLAKRKNGVASLLIFFVFGSGLFISFDHVNAVGLSMYYKCVEMPYRHADPKNATQIKIAKDNDCVYHARYNRWMHKYDNGSNVPTVPNPSECFRDSCADESKVVTVFDRKYRVLRTNVAPVADEGKATVVLDKKDYRQGENMIASANGSYFVKCGNNAPVIISGRINNSGAWQEIINQRFKGSTGSYVWHDLTPRSKIFKAPTTCGAHTFNVLFRLTHGGNMTRYASIPFNVACIEGNIAVGAATCANESTNEKGIVNVTLNNFRVTGTSTQLPAPTYEFKCGAQPWTTKRTSNTYACAFDRPGTYTVQVRATTGSYTKTFVQNNIVVAQCDQDGACGDRDIAVRGPYSWQDTTWGPTSFCDDDARLAGAPPQFPNSYDTDVTWTCNGIGAGESAQCRNRINQPLPCACGTDGGSFIETTPSENACQLGTMQNLPSSNGMWSWICGSNAVCTPDSQPCSAECVRIDIDAPSNIYLSKDGNELDVEVRIEGKNNVDLISGTCDITVGGVTKQANVQSNGITEKMTFDYHGAGAKINAECTLSVNCGGGGTFTERTYTDEQDVTSLCMERSCSPQGTCQATPKSGVTSVNDCTSTCTSDADCSSGRMIETRP
jgi:hypothetical protein